MISEDPYGHPLDFTAAPPDPLYPENITRQSAFGTFLEQSDWMEKSQDEDYNKAWLIKAGLDDVIEVSMFHEMFSHYRDGVQKLSICSAKASLAKYFLEKSFKRS
ncbi:hypothetical protein TWF788_010864 [Orbilia oligospora]|uniref:Uncharacterized protein n=1 Tax=Orbilia oligospora TaxID=2813651 RepID=A0A7C8PHU2_ORBOL|nr:hypothetical protein TWF788_010864 [Orbilia oligospora]